MSIHDCSSSSAGSTPAWPRLGLRGSAAMPSRKRAKPAEPDTDTWLEAHAIRQQTLRETVADWTPDADAWTDAARRLAGSSGGLAAASSASSSAGPAPSMYQDSHRAVGLALHRQSALMATGFEPQRHTWFIEGRPVQARDLREHSGRALSSGLLRSVSRPFFFSAPLGEPFAPSTRHSLGEPFAPLLAKAGMQSSSVHLAGVVVDSRAGHCFREGALLAGAVQSGSRAGSLRQVCDDGSALPSQRCSVLRLAGLSP